MKYHFSFKGRQSGAIGVFYRITETYQAENMSEAKSMLYRDYEHIVELKINGTTELNREFSEAPFITVAKRDYFNNPRK